MQGAGRGGGELWPLAQSGPINFNNGSAKLLQCEWQLGEKEIGLFPIKHNFNWWRIHPTSLYNMKPSEKEFSVCFEITRDLCQKGKAIMHPVRDYSGMPSAAYLIGVKAHIGVDCVLDCFLRTWCSLGENVKARQAFCLLNSIWSLLCLPPEILPSIWEWMWLLYY